MTERIWRSTRRRPIEDRLTEKIDRRGPDDCWPWRAAAANDMGHGQISYQRRPVKAHRVAFMLAYGYLPPVVRHKCDNPPCCNPAHLEPGTIADNHRDMVERGRIPRGDNHWRRRNPVEFPHGTISRYRQGCRCEPCKADNARVAREYRSSRRVVQA